MKIPKMKFKVNIICSDDSYITGFMHVDEGYRLLDFLNETKKEFLALTEVSFKSFLKKSSLKAKEKGIKKDFILLNRKAIKWVEEVKPNE